jgi:hypothetical protein
MPYKYHQNRGEPANTLGSSSEDSIERFSETYAAVAVRISVRDLSASIRHIRPNAKRPVNNPMKLRISAVECIVESIPMDAVGRRHATIVMAQEVNIRMVPTGRDMKLDRVVLVAPRKDLRRISAREITCTTLVELDTFDWRAESLSLSMCCPSRSLPRADLGSVDMK